MRKAVRGMAAGLALMLFASMAPVKAQAATKPINSVSLRVDSNLEAGSHLPDIEIGSGSAQDGGVRIYSSGSRYQVTAAEWVDKSSSYVLETAAEPRMKVTLEPEDVGEYYFLAGYTESDVKVSGGTYVSARRDGDSLTVTLRVKPVRGELDPPRDAYWHENNLGEARWEAGENDSGAYGLQLLRDGKSVKKVDKTTSRSYNFYPYMTQEGEYTFKVRTIPSTDAQEKYGKSSGYVESGGLQITDRYVSDGKGQQNANSSSASRRGEDTGWYEEGEARRYRYPDGSLCTGWGQIDGLWYYFDGQGAMQKGWIQAGGLYYYLKGDGQMAVGWTEVEDKWYYMRPEAEDGRYPEGSAVSGGWRVIGAYYYFFNGDGSMYTGWLGDGGHWYYLNTVENSMLGAMFTGWIRRDGKTYYTDTNGVMMEGWCQVDGSWFYFYPGSGELAQNTWVDGTWVDGDGIWRK